jgi:uncharacterized protein YybS (DUF2232 family)
MMCNYRVPINIAAEIYKNFGVKVFIFQEFCSWTMNACTRNTYIIWESLSTFLALLAIAVNRFIGHFQIKHFICHDKNN